MALTAEQQAQVEMNAAMEANRAASQAAQEATRLKLKRLVWLKKFWWKTAVQKLRLKRLIYTSAVTNLAASFSFFCK
jgi:hypothetical protein